MSLPSQALQHRLTKLGLSLNHAIFVNLFLANMGHFAAANSIYCRYFPTVNPPSRACVQVGLLWVAGLLHSE